MVWMTAYSVSASRNVSQSHEELHCKESEILFTSVYPYLVHRMISIRSFPDLQLKLKKGKYFILLYFDMSSIYVHGSIVTQFVDLCNSFLK